MADQFYLNVSDRSLLKLEGADALDLIQRISTNDVAHLKVGEHIETVFTSEKGRIVDIVLAFRPAPNSLILAGNRTDAPFLQTWVEKFIVMEDVRVTPMATTHLQYLLFNVNKENIRADLTRLGVLCAELTFHSSTMILMVIGKELREELERILQERGFVVSDARHYSRYRVENGIPGYPNEISEQFNPLELGLESLINFTKGCYVGQEIIARLDTYEKVRRNAQRFNLSVEPISVPTNLFNSKKEIVGILTSYSQQDDDNSWRGLGLASFTSRGSTLNYQDKMGGVGGSAWTLPSLDGVSR